MIKERKTDVEYEIIMSSEQCIRGRNNPLEDHLFLQHLNELSTKKKFMQFDAE